MNLRQLPYILAIESAGTLLGASKQLGISQPALSKYLSELEDETGMALFYRVRKQMIPTAAGNLYLNAAKHILHLSNQTYESIHTLEQTEFETISIGVSPHRGARFLAKIYPEMVHFFPNCRVDPVEGYAEALKKAVADGRIAFAITSHNGPLNPDLDQFQLSAEEIVLGVPAFYTIVHHSPRTVFSELPFADLNDFDKYFFIMPQKTSGLYLSIKDTLEELPYRPITAFTTPNVMMQKELIEAGTGIGLLPAYYAVPNDTIAYFRLNQRMYMNGCIIFRKDHHFTDAEKFLIYLHKRNNSDEMPKAIPMINNSKFDLLCKEQEELYQKLRITRNPFSSDSM